MTSTTLTTTSLETLFKPIPYQVVHTSKGRIRLRVPDLIGNPDLIRNPDYADRLEHLIQACPCVTEVWINPKASSVVIYYRSDQISSHAFQEQLAIALQRVKLSAILPHSTHDLAKRLGVAFQALTWHRSQTDFGEWSRHRDPEGIAWNYDASSKSFLPDTARCDRRTQTPSKSGQILLALGGAASVKAGTMLGKLAGEVLGLLLLGTTGMVLGAEAGAFVGEVVGTELASMW